MPLMAVHEGEEGEHGVPDRAYISVYKMYNSHNNS